MPFLNKFINAVQEFPNLEDDEIIVIAKKRDEREKNAPIFR